ncbi:MAG TPA: ADP-ribosylglycohydrolase family protein, partial [Clostridia bacterium]|nr:ADP-ribosylglycohydrolase family protein [Clostridia bacterium]
MKESSIDLKSGKIENEAERDSVLGAIMGLCVADAMGVPVEFKSREERKEDPVTEMRGYGTFNLPP